MRCLKRNKRTVYVCEHYQDEYITKFKEPKKVLINYQVTNSEGDLIALGLEFPKYIRIKADLSEINNFHEEDRVYISIQPQEPFDELCKDANYEVDSEPVESLNSIEVTLKKLSGK